MLERAQAALAILCAVAVAGCGEPAADAGWAGYVEGEYVQVASPLAGTLARLEVRRGVEVSQGAPLFALEADAERAAREEAAARLENARAIAANAGKGRRADEIAVTRAQLHEAQAAASLATAELARQEQLVKQGFVSQSRLDDARSQVQRTRAQVSEAGAALRVAELPARSDEREAAAALVAAAEQALKQAEWREQQKRLAAPVDARVADTFFRTGEWVAAGQPVVSLLPPGATKARFFVPESQVAALAVGQPVTIACDGCGTPITARVEFIATSAEYTPPVIYSNAQRAKLVFMVEARPSAEDGARLKPGLPVDVRPARASAP